MNALNLKYETEKKEKEIALLSSDKKIQQLQLEKQNAELAGNKLLAKQKENEIELLKQSTMLKDFELKRSYDELREKTLDALFKEQKLKLAEQQQIINEKQFQNERLVRNSLIGVFIVAGIIVFSLFNRFQLKKKLEKQTALNNERLRIATELHDEVGSDLSGINVYSSVAKMQFEQDKNLATGTLNKISEHTQSTIQTMQDIVGNKPKQRLYRSTNQTNESFCYPAYGGKKHFV
ncbi:MAG: histidine kinase dimerization/phosphoacceptor domain-containing protein [Bacteroidetes bacterium]|nr:histidine kinase dimerization/phosphoacceptor domain-containing protein [Bacteroidota bacterium]